MRCRYGEICYLTYKTNNLTATLLYIKVAFPFKYLVEDLVKNIVAVQVFDLDSILECGL